MFLFRNRLKGERHEHSSPLAGFSLLQRPRFGLGALSIFLYVGAEVSIGSLIVNYLQQSRVMGLNEAAAGSLIAFYWGGAMVGRFLGALALCIAVVLFVSRFWGALATGTQVGLLTAGTLAMLGLTEFAARREKTLYFAGLAALVLFAAYTNDLEAFAKSGAGTFVLVDDFIDRTHLQVSRSRHFHRHLLSPHQY